MVSSGRGDVTLTPDRAVIRLMVETRAPTAAEASSSNAVRTRRVLDTLTTIKLPAESVQVVGVSVRPNENYERGELINYEAGAVVRVTIRNLDRLGRLLDAAFAAGATTLASVMFESDREDAARRDALAKAFGEARANADALARAAGANLGPLMRVTTEREPWSDGNLMAYASMRAARDFTITPEDVVVRASVVTTWRLVRSGR